MAKIEELSAGGDSIHAVALTLDILELVADAGQPLGVTEVAAHLGMGKSRVFRHLRMLCQRDYLFQDPETEKYQASAALFAIGRSLFMSNSWFNLVKPQMRPLMEKLNATVTLSQIEGNELVVIDVCAATHSISVMVPVGYRMDLHATAHGKAALAFGPPRLAEMTMARPLRALTSETITDHQTLRVELDRVRDLGWATSRDECVVGMTAVAAPILMAGGQAVGGLGIISSSQRVGDTPNPDLLEPLLSITRMASERLGGSQRPETDPNGRRNR